MADERLSARRLRGDTMAARGRRSFEQMRTLQALTAALGAARTPRDAARTCCDELARRCRTTSPALYLGRRDGALRRPGGAGRPLDERGEALLATSRLRSARRGPAAAARRRRRRGLGRARRAGGARAWPTAASSARSWSARRSSRASTATTSACSTSSPTSPAWPARTCAWSPTCARGCARASWRRRRRSWSGSTSRPASRCELVDVTDAWSAPPRGARRRGRRRARARAAHDRGDHGQRGLRPRRGGRPAAPAGAPRAARRGHGGRPRPPRRGQLRQPPEGGAGRHLDAAPGGRRRAGARHAGSACSSASSTAHAAASCGCRAPGRGPRPGHRLAGALPQDLEQRGDRRRRPLVAAGSTARSRSRAPPRPAAARPAGPSASSRSTAIEGTSGDARGPASTQRLTASRLEATSRLRGSTSAAAQQLLELAAVDRAEVAHHERRAGEVGRGQWQRALQAARRPATPPAPAGRPCTGAPTRSPRPCGRSAAPRRPRCRAAPPARAPRPRRRTSRRARAAARAGGRRPAAGRASRAPRRPRCAGAGATSRSAVCTASAASSALASSATACGRSAVPAAVGRTAPRPRTSSSVPTLRSSACTSCETVGCETPSRSAAREKPPYSSTARKASRRRVARIPPASSIGICLWWQAIHALRR